MSADLLDHWVIARAAFFPRRCWFRSPFVIESKGARLACSFHRADRGGLTVVHFHGNGEVVSDYLDGFPSHFTSNGHDLLLTEYRGYGMSTGEVELGAMLDDVEQVIRGTGVDPERIVLFGRSIGSIFALEGAARFPRVAGLILESAIAEPMASLRMRGVSHEDLGVTPEAFAAAVGDRLNHQRKMAAYGGKTLVLHALFDDLVDVTNAERLASWAGGPVTLRIFDRGHHNTMRVDNEAAYFGAVKEHLAVCGRAP
ncbi:MAG TPA: alpha/beta fold hydrolase [Anaeromyxobacteraceae bacterium]|nr:alpha/beta fold hydrolase [Anaeromyxobacteraceae bacterium]